MKKINKKVLKVVEIGMINDLQKAIKANKVITFLGGGEL